MVIPFTKARLKVVSILLGLTVVICGSTMHKWQPTPYSFRYPQNFGSRINVPADNATTVEGVKLGKMLFYEKRLSAGNNISCGTCHQQSKAFTDGLTFSKGKGDSFATRNSMSLANLLWTRKFFWDGRSESLEEQAAFPLTNAHEMAQPIAVSVKKLQNIRTYPSLFQAAFGDAVITPERIIKALSQFQRTLISADAPYDKYLDNQYQPSDLELQGLALFITMPRPEKGIRGADCAHCHGGAKTYLEIFHNNGLDSISKDVGRQSLTGFVSDHGRFKVPTLRNIALTAPYMHDGRLLTLEDVLDHYSEHLEPAHLSPFLKNVSNHPGGTSLHLTKAEKKAFITFLNMLTDSSFITNPAFAKPEP